MRFFISILLLLTFTFGYSQKLPKDTWKIVSTDSEEKSDQVFGSGLASCAIDNNPNTFWQTSFFNTRPYPHHITIDFGGCVNIHRFTFYPRKKYYAGRIAEYKLFIGEDTLNWNLVHSGKFVRNNINDYTPRYVTLKKDIKGRYVKFVVESAINKPDRCIYLAEMDVEGRYVSPIALPRMHIQRDTIYSGEAATFKAQPFVQNTSIKSIEWYFPDGDPSRSTEDSPSVRYHTYGKHSVQLTLTTIDGIRKSIYAKNAITYLPAHELKRTRWKTTASEQEVTLEDDTTTNITDNKPTTFWQTNYYFGKKLPHYLIIDLGKETEIHGIGYLPRQSEPYYGTFQSYDIFISNDTLDFGKKVIQVTENKPYRNLRYIEFPSKKGRYLKILINKTFPLNNNYAAASEIFIYGNEPYQWNTILIITITIILLISILLFFIKNHKNKIKKNIALTTKTTSIDTKNDQPVRIMLFGKFQLTNNGEEPEQFFNKIKQIFALITYHTIDNNGIPTSQLNQLFWADLPEENVSGARSSNIKKLRTVLQEIPSLEIVIEKKLWILKASEESVSIDFETYRKLHNTLIESLNSNRFNNTQVDHFLTIIERGKFLEDFETEWAEKLRSIISEEIADLLHLILTNHSEKVPAEMKVRISDCLFMQDELNVDALKIKFQLYKQKSNLGMAKKLYDNYVQKYELIYKTDFPISLTKLMED